MKTLYDIGFEKGLQYETVITTMDESNVSNAAPIGVICRGKNNIMCRIFKGSKTLENILETEKFTVNILRDPLVFTKSTLSTVDSSYLGKDLDIECCDSYFTCSVTKLIKAIKRSDPINKVNAIVIKADVDKIVVKKENKTPFNRSFGLLIETLENYTYFDENPQYYLERLKEAKRVITKVGSKQEKKAILQIKKSLEERGFRI